MELDLSKFTPPTEDNPALDLSKFQYKPGTTLSSASTLTRDRSIGLDNSALDQNNPFTYDLNEHRAQNQTITDKWISGGIKGLSTFATATGQTAAAVGGGIVATSMAALGNDFDSDTVFKNPVLTWFKELDELVKERNPNYATQAETNASVLSNMGTANFWSDDFLNGVGFLASAVVTGMGAGALGVKAGLAGLGKFGTSLNTFQAAVAGRVGESAIEANDTYEQTVQQLEARREAGEINLTDGEIEERAKKARAETFGFNMALAIPDAYQLGKIFKTIKGKSVGKGLFGGSKVATAAEQALIESQEENFQLSVSNMAIKMATNTATPQTEAGSKEYIGNLIGGMVDNFGTKEGQKSMVLGGLLGGGMGAIMKNGENRTDIPEEILKRNKHILAGLNNDIDLDTLEALAVEKNDLITERLVKEGRLINMVYNKLTTGKIEDLEAELEGLGKNKPEDFAEIGIEVSQQEIAEQHAQIKHKIKTFTSLYNKLSPDLHEAVRGNLFYVHAVRNSIAAELSALAPQVAAVTAAQELAKTTGVEFSMEDPLTYGDEAIVPEEIIADQEKLKENYKALTNYSNKVKRNKTVQAELIANWEQKFPKVVPNDSLPEEDAKPIGVMQEAGKPNVDKPYSKKVVNKDGSTTFSFIEEDGTTKTTTYNPGEFFDNIGEAGPNRSKAGKQEISGNERFNFLQIFRKFAQDPAYNADTDALMKAVNDILLLPDWKERIKFTVNKRDINLTDEQKADKAMRGTFHPDVHLLPSTVMHINLEILPDGAEEFVSVNHGMADPFRFVDNDLNPYIFENMTPTEFYEKFAFSKDIGTAEEQFEEHAREQQNAIKFWNTLSTWYDQQNSTENLEIPSEFFDVQAVKRRWKHTEVGEWSSPTDHVFLKDDSGNYVIVDTNDNASIVNGEFYEPPSNVLDETEGTRYLAKVNHPSLGELWVKAAPANMTATEKKAFVDLVNKAVLDPEAHIAELNEMAYIAYKGNWNLTFDIAKKGKERALRLDVYNKAAGIHHRNVVFDKAGQVLTVQDISNLIKEKTGIELGAFPYKRNLAKGQITNEQVEKIFTINVTPEIVTGANLKYTFNENKIEVEPVEPTAPSDPDIDPDAGIVGGLEAPEGDVFKKSPKKAEEVMDYNSAVAWLKKVLPSHIIVKTMDDTIANIEERQYTWGMFSDNVIYLSEFAGEGTQHHEAFHAVFRTLLNDKQIAALYVEAEKKWGIRADLTLEELMADEFMKWKADRTFKVGNLARALYNKIMDFIQFITSNETLLDATFKRIDTGAFQNKELVKKEHYKFNSPVFKVLFGAKYFKMSAVRSEQVIKTAAAEVIDGFVDLTTAEDVTRHQIIEEGVRKFMARRAASFNPDAVINQTLVESFKDPKGEKNKMKSLEGIYSHEPNIKLVIAEVQKLVNSYDISSVVKEQEDLESDEQTEKQWDIHQGEHGGWATVSKEIKIFIGLTTFESTDEFNRKITSAIDFPLVFSALQRRLAGMDRAQQIVEFRSFARTDPQIKALYAKFINQTGYDIENGTVANKMLFNRFLNTFEMESMNYIQSLRTKDKGTNRPSIIALSANRETPDKLHVENWQRKSSEENNLAEPETRKTTVRGIRSALSAFKMKEPTDAQLDKASDKVIAAVREFGMDLSKGYVLESLEVLYRNKTSRNRMLESEDLVILSGLIENGDNIYEKTYDKEGEIIDETGAITTLEGIASGDINYRSDIYDTNFQDFQNKSRYAFVLPSYILTKLREYRSKGQAGLEQLRKDPYFKHNPLVQADNALELLANLDPAFTGDYRDDIQEEDGITFKTTNPKSLLLTWYGLYNPSDKYSYYTPMIYEAKSTSISVKMENKKGWVDKNGAVTKETSEYIVDTLFTQEHQRLNDQIFVGAHAANSSRWVNLPFLNGIKNKGNLHNGIPYSDWSLTDIQQNKNGVRTALKARISEALQNEITVHQDELVKFGILSETKKGLKDNLLGIADNNIGVHTGNYYINDFINSIAVSQLLQGDLSIVEDPFSRVKRNGGELAYGTHFGEGQSRVVYKEGHIEDRPGFSNVDTDDAQVWTSVARRKLQLNRLGRLTPRLEGILDKIDRGEPLTDEELKPSPKTGEVLDLLPLKTVYYDGIGGIYHKMSESMLTKELTSNLVDGVWVAKPGKEKAHNMREFLDKEHEEVSEDGTVTTYRIDSVVTTSASKILTKAKPLTDAQFANNELDEFEYLDTENKYQRLQVETHSGKEKITSGTQMAQLINLFSQDEAMIERYHDLMGENRAMDFEMAVTVAGSPELLARKLLNAVESTGGDAQIVELLRTTNGEFDYNFNLPHIVKKLEQIFIAHFSKGVLQQKVPGYKLTLMSSNGLNKENGEPLRMHYKDKNNKIQLAEVMMTRRALSKILGPQAAVQDIASINKSLLRMVGTRIPTQAHHSMMPFKVVEFLPEYYGDTIIAPAEITALSGADYDIDSMFVYRKDFYTKKDKETKEVKVIEYGSATDVTEWYEEYNRYHMSTNTDLTRTIRNKQASNPEVKYAEHRAEAFEEFGLAPSLVDFTQLENQKTNGARNNEIVDIYLNILTDPNIPDLFDPVTLDPLHEAANLYHDKIRDKANLERDNPKMHYGINGKLAAHTATATGKRNVGPIAFANNVSAFFTNEKIKIKDGIDFLGLNYADYSVTEENDIAIIQHPSGEFEVGKKPIDGLKTDSMSTLVSGMTDDAKWGFSAKLNLEFDNLGTFANMISLGMGFNRTMLFANQDILFTLSAKLKNTPGLKMKAALKELISDTKNRLPASKDYVPVTLSEDILLDAITKGSTPEIDMAILEKFDELNKLTAQFINVGTIISLNKGVEVTSILALDKKLRTISEIFDNTSKDPTMIGLTDALRNNSNTRENIRIARNIKTELVNWFIASRPIYTRINESVRRQLPEFISDEDAELLDRSLKSYITFRGLKKVSKNPDFRSFNALLDPNVKSKDIESTLIQQIEALSSQADTQAAEDFNNNEFIKILKLEKKFLDSGLKNNENKAEVDLVISNMRLKKSPLTIDRIVNGFLDIQMNHPELAVNLLKYAMAKDNMNFTQTSYLKYINIALMKQVSNGLDVMMKEGHIVDDADIQEFQTLFFLYKPNNKFAPGFFIKDLNNKGALSNQGAEFVATSIETARSMPYVFKSLQYINEEVGTISTFYTKVSEDTWARTKPFGSPSRGQMHLTPEQNIELDNIHSISVLSGTVQEDPGQASPGTSVKPDIETGVQHELPKSEFIPITYTPKGKETQTYGVKGTQIFNRKGDEVFKEDSADRTKIFANLAVQQGRAKVIEHKGSQYVVNEREQIVSVTSGKIMKWGPENGDRIAILKLAKPAPEVLTDLSTEELEKRVKAIDPEYGINEDFADDEGIEDEDGNLRPATKEEIEAQHRADMIAVIERGNEPPAANPFEDTTGTPIPGSGGPIKESRRDTLTENNTTDDAISYNFTKAIKKLSKRFNIPVELVHQPDATWRGRYVGGIVYLNTALLTADTPFHEFAHPFIEVVRVKNPALYQSLTDEIIKEKKIMQQVMRLYPDLDKAGRMDEAIVTAIGLYAGEIASVPKSMATKILDFLKEMARVIHEFWFPGSQPLISELNPNTSLRDIASMLAKGSERYTIVSQDAITNDMIKEQRAVKLTVQPEHVEQVREGKKVISLRDVEDATDTDPIEFAAGDTLSVYANSKAQGITVKLKTVETMEKLEKKNEDKFAQALGYENFKDFKKKDQYANESSEMSRRFPNVYKFLQGEKAIQILFYEKVAEFEPGTETKTEKLVKDIKIALTKQIDRYDARISAKEAQSEKATLFVNKRKKMVRGLDAISDAQGVIKYIQEAKADLAAAKNRLDVAINEAGNIKNLSDEKRTKLINDINYVQEFISAYSILTSEELSEDKIKEMLGDTQIAKDYIAATVEYKNIISKTDDVVVPLLASWLIDFSDIDADAARKYFKQRIDRIKASNKNQKKKDRLIKKLVAQQEELVLTQEKLEQQLREATRDIGFGSLWLEAAISSSDQVSSLFAKAVKNQEFKANLKDAIAQEQLGQVLEDYEKKVGKKNNADKFYKDFYHTVKVAMGKDTDGKVVTEDRLVFADTHPTPEGQALLDMMKEVYAESLEQIPKGHRDKLVVKIHGTNIQKYSLPFTRKSGADRIQSNGLLATVKADFEEIYKPLSTDTEYGFQTEAGEVIKSIPLFYTQRGIGDRATSNKDISKDLVGSLLKFTQMSNKYSMYKQIQTEVELFERTIEKRKVASVDTKGERIQDRVAKTFGLTTYLNSDTKRVNERVQAFINMQFYGMQEKPNIFTVSVKGEEYEIDTNKLLNFLGRWTGFTTLALNFLSALNNVILGNFYIFQESVARQNFGDLKFDLSKGKQLYYQGTGRMFSDVGKLSNVSKETQLVRMFDAIQGDFRDVSGGFVTGTALKKRWTLSNLFFLNHAGEHEMQVSTLFAALAGKKVKTKAGEEMSLWDAYELGPTGVLQLKEGVEFSQKDQFKLMNQLHATNKSLHGNYNDFDKTVTQRTAVGRLALMFRKFMAPGIRRRFGKLIADNELDELHEGYFAASTRLILDETQELSKWLMHKENSLSEYEKASVKKTIAEVGMWITTMAMFAMASSALGDDDDNWAGNLALYEIRRFQTELGFYFNPAEALKIIKSPAAATTTAQRIIKFGDQLLHTAAFDDEHTTYQTSGKGYKKGDSKLWAATKDLIPAIQGIERSLHPEAAIKYFDKLF